MQSNSPEVKRTQPPNFKDSPCEDISKYRQLQQKLYSQNQLMQYFVNHTQVPGVTAIPISKYPELNSQIIDVLTQQKALKWDYDPIKTPFIPPMVDKRGVTYEGQWLTGQRHGRGFLIGPAGTHYFEGEFRSGRRHGQGRCIFLKGKGEQKQLVVQIGYWEHGKYVGEVNPHPKHEHNHEHGKDGGCCSGH